MSAEQKGRFSPQWKGTDICVDFVCPACDAEGHHDGYGCYVIQCGGCGAVFTVGDPPLIPGNANPQWWTPQVIEVDDDDVEPTP